MTDIKKRVTTGVVACFLLYLMLKVYVLTIVVILGFLYLTSIEFYDILKKAFEKNIPSGLISDVPFGSIGYYLIPFLFLFSPPFVPQPFLTTISLILGIILSVVHRLYQYSVYSKASKVQDPIKTLSFSCFAMILGDIFFCVFIAFPFSFSLLMANLENGNKFVFLWLFTTFQIDNGALLFGRLFGSFRPFPYISPQKTIQGLIGAYVLCLISLVCIIPFGGFGMVPVLSFNDCITITLFGSSFAVIGDLTESFFKRVGDVKDSGNLFPGHGGILDRLDSLVWVAPFLYYYSLYYLAK